MICRWKHLKSDHVIIGVAQNLHKAYEIGEANSGFFFFWFLYILCKVRQYGCCVGTSAVGLPWETFAKFCWAVLNLCHFDRQ
jgi:hypothetical protein